MNNLFMPMEDLGTIEDMLKNKEVKGSSDNILLISDIDAKMYTFMDRDKEPELFRGLSNLVMAMTLHKEKIHYGGFCNDGGPGKSKRYIIFSYPGIGGSDYSPCEIHAICSHKESLYHAGEDGKIYNTFSEEIVSDLKMPIQALCSYKGEMYAGAGRGIFNVTKNKVEAIRPAGVYTLCEHKGKLYDSGQYKKIYSTLEIDLEEEKKMNKPWMVAKRTWSLMKGKPDLELTPNKVIAEREYSISNICSHNGILYDSTFGKNGSINETMINKKIYSGEILAMLSVPKNIMGEISK